MVSYHFSIVLDERYFLPKQGADSLVQDIFKIHKVIILLVAYKQISLLHVIAICL